MRIVSAGLVDYQSPAYAAEYETFVHRIRSAEKRASDDPGLPFTRAVARSLFKLMAYKDEYEVARLYTDGTFKRYLTDVFEGDYSLNFHLMPPIFAPVDTATGLPGKRRFPGFTSLMFRILCALQVSAWYPFRSFWLPARTD